MQVQDRHLRWLSISLCGPGRRVPLYQRPAGDEQKKACKGRTNPRAATEYSDTASSGHGAGRSTCRPTQQGVPPEGQFLHMGKEQHPVNGSEPGSGGSGTIPGQGSETGKSGWPNECRYSPRRPGQQVPKTHGQFPSERRSVNDGIELELCTLRYISR